MAQFSELYNAIGLTLELNNSIDLAHGSWKLNIIEFIENIAFNALSLKFM